MRELNWDGPVVQNTLYAVHTWLGSTPDLNTLVDNLPALELVGAAHLNNPDSNSLSLAAQALERVNLDRDFAAFSNLVLAAMIRLNLRMLGITREKRFRDGGIRAIEAAKARFDEKNGYFRSGASDASGIFYTDANARLGEAFYLDVAALDDQSLRPIAGEVLGQVSDIFDADAGLYGRIVMPDGVRDAPGNLGVYAAAMDLFLTAAETTGRATYNTRACIIANFALSNVPATNASQEECIMFAGARLRLYGVVRVGSYQRRASEILSSIIVSGLANIKEK